MKPKNKWQSTKDVLLMLETTPMSILLYDSDLRLIECNMEAVTMFGYESKKKFMDDFSLHTNSARYQSCGTPTEVKAKEVMEQVSLKGRCDFEWTYINISGEEIHTEISFARINLEGDFVLIAHIRDMRDILAARESEFNALMRQQQMYDTSPVASSLWSSDLTPLAANDAMVNLLGISNRTEFLHRYKDFNAKIQPGGLCPAEKTAQMMEQVRKNGTYNYQWIYVTTSGEEVLGDCVAVRVDFIDFWMLAVYFYDLRQIMAAQEKERKTLMRQQQLYDANPVPTALWSSDAKPIACNDATVNLLGLSCKDDFVLHLADITPEFQPCGRTTIEKAEFVSKIVEADGAYRFPWIFLTKSGEEVLGDCVAVRIDTDDDWMVSTYFQDLREVMRAQGELREAHQLNQAILDAAPFVVGLWDNNSMPMLVSERAKTMFGVDEPMVLGERLFDFSPEFQPCGTPTPELAVYYANKAFAEGGVTFEWMHTGPDGEEMPVECIYECFEHEGRKMMVSFTRDLREIKVAQKREQYALTRQQRMYEANPIASSLWSSDRKPLDCNDAMVKMLEMSSKDDFIYGFYDYNPEIQPCGLSTNEKIVEIVNTVEKKGICHYQWLFLNKSGEEILGDCVAVRIDLEDDWMLSVYFYDLRDILKAQEKERKAAERTQLIFDAAPLVIQYWNRNLECFDCNQATIDFYGFDKKEDYIAVHQNISHSSSVTRATGLLSWEKWDNFLEEVFIYEHSFTDFAEVSKDGSVMYFETVGTKVMLDDEPVVITYTNDVTDVKIARDERHKFLVAEESNRAKSRFLARMSHEIRTPITSILGISEISLRSPNLHADMEEPFGRIFNSATSLLHIINDILDLSKIEAGEAELEQNEYELASTIMNVSHLHLSFLQDKDVEFRLCVGEQLPTCLIGDHLRIEQIITNLLSNAFKYTMAGHVSLEFKHQICTDDGQIDLIISVTDTGVGMTKEQLELIYHDYTRFYDSHAMPGVMGTGLGMPIVHSLVNLMGGKITLESEMGIGTTVTVKIPQKVKDKAALGQEAATKLQKFEYIESTVSKVTQIEHESMSYGKVLVVDDVDANLYVASGLLQLYDIEVDTCSSGHAAAHKIREGNVYDIIFMDYMMPGLDGVETMGILREMGYDLPIVALTANAMIGAAEEFIEKGFDGFLSKPIQTKRLDAILKKYIRDKQLPEVIAAASIEQKKARRPIKVNLNEFKCDSHLIEKLQGDFIKSQRNTFVDISRDIEAKNFLDAELKAHSLKGFAGLISEVSLVAAAEYVEMALRSRQVPDDEIMSDLKSELSYVLAKIDISPPQPASVLGPIANTVSLLSELKPLLESRKASARSFVDRLRSIPEAAILVRQIEKFDFPAALKSLDILISIFEEEIK
ncbi:MAG: ATP-binding protein [Defluviitaleaceae bacterium]|nr:ATP-binding protein [Defluviitaleaceae bacterium]